MPVARVSSTARGIEHPAIRRNEPGRAGEIAHAQRLEHDRRGGRRADFERHLAFADEEEFIGRFALVKQIFAGMEDMVAGAAGDEPDQLRRGAGKERMLLQICSSVAMLLLCLRLRVCPDRRRFDRDVDPDWTPGDAAAAADATRRAELINPSRELVRHPLPIARTRRVADAAAMDKREIHGEAGIPFPHPFCRRAAQIAVILYRRTEAGGANHGAVAAGQAALGDVVPARMIEVAQQQLPQSLRLQPAAHLICRSGDDRRRFRTIFVRCRRVAELA